MGGPMQNSLCPYASSSCLMLDLQGWSLPGDVFQTARDIRALELPGWSCSREHCADGPLVARSPAFSPAGAGCCRSGWPNWNGHMPVLACREVHSNGAAPRSCALLLIAWGEAQAHSPAVGCHAPLQRPSSSVCRSEQILVASLM